MVYTLLIDRLHFGNQNIFFSAGKLMKTLLYNLQVKQNHIARIIYNKMKRKTKLKPLYKKLKFLNVEGLFRLEIAKFIMKLNTNKLPDILTKKIAKVASVHL